MTFRTRAFDLFLLAPLGIAVVAYQLAEPGEIIPPIALIVCVLARAVQDVSGWVLGRRPIAVAVLLAIAYVLVDISRNQFQVTLFADFMMILGALKAMERRTPRDDGQLLVVSIFLALSAAVSSNRMGTGVLLVVYLFALMLAVMRMQIDAATWPATPRRGRLWPLLGACIVGTTLVASVAFVLLPRNTMRWSSNQFTPVTQRVSGFRESVELGSGGLISQDPREVMRVWSESSLGEPAPMAEGAPLYLRGVVLSEYEPGSRGGRWSREERPRRVRSEEFGVLPGTSVSIGSADRAEQTAVLRVVQYAGASTAGTIFTAWRPIFATFVQAEGTLLRDEDDFSMRFDGSLGGTIEYRITYGADAEPRAAGPRGRPPAPSGSAILREAAVRALESAGIEPDPSLRPTARDGEAIRAMESWLRSSKGYTLEIEPAPPGRDPTEWFVEEAEAGHCEYFASALALLCREVGIHSRVATGYLSMVEDADEGFARVRRSDAHAWVEAQIAPGYWGVFDATPAALGQPLNAPVDPFTRWLSSLESLWLASFISFDARSQSSLSRSLQRSLPFDRLNPSSEEVSEAADLPWTRIAAGAVFFGGMAAFILLAHRRWRGGGSRPLYGVGADAIRRRDQLDLAWQQAGRPRPAGTTLLAHATRLGGSDTDEASAIERLAFGSVRE